MAANRLVHTESSASQSTSGTWTTMTAYDESVTIQSTSSVVILAFTATIFERWDSAIAFRFVVDGSPVGPIGQSWSDDIFESQQSCTMVYAMTGYSGTTTIDVQVIDTLSSGNDISTTTVPSSLDIIEIENGASIIVNKTVTNGGSPGATRAALMSDTSISVGSTSSILLFLATVPFEYNGTDDGMTELMFGIDSTPEGPASLGRGDFTGGVDSASAVYAKSGVSAGTHSFECNWKYTDGTGVDQHSTYTGTFQVIEITADATLHASINSTGAWTLTGTVANDPNLDTDETISDADSVVVWGSTCNIDYNNSSRYLLMRLGLDDTSVGGNLRLFNDGNNDTQSGDALLSSATMTAASHSFQLRGLRDGNNNHDIDDTENRHLFVLELTPTSPVSSRRVFII